MGNYLYKQWEDNALKHVYKYNHEPLMTTFNSIELELNYTVCYANLGDEPRCWCSPFESISVQVIFKRNLVGMRNSEAVALDGDIIALIKATDFAFKGRFSNISDFSAAKWGKEENKNVFLQTCKQFTDHFNADPRPFEPKLSVAALKRCVEKAENHSVEVPAAVTVALQQIEAMKEEAAAKIKADAKAAKKERDAAKAQKDAAKALVKAGKRGATGAAPNAKKPRIQGRAGEEEEEEENAIVGEEEEEEEAEEEGEAEGEESEGEDYQPQQTVKTATVARHIQVLREKHGLLSSAIKRYGKNMEHEHEEFLKLKALVAEMQKSVAAPGGAKELAKMNEQDVQMRSILAMMASLVGMLAGALCKKDAEDATLKGALVVMQMMVMQMETVFQWDHDRKKVIYHILKDQQPFQDALNLLTKTAEKKTE